MGYFTPHEKFADAVRVVFGAGFVPGGWRLARGGEGGGSEEEQGEQGEQQESEGRHAGVEPERKKGVERKTREADGAKESVLEGGFPDNCRRLI
jgi:hypothetical protein